ncbi:hypothetical protein NY750_08110, partial [Escherichia coli]|nr:hypothetical protein [Escherichia coli]
CGNNRTNRGGFQFAAARLPWFISTRLNYQAHFEIQASTLISRNPFAPREIEPVIGEAVNVIVQISKTSEGRRIKEIREIQGYENGEYISQLIAA